MRRVSLTTRWDLVAIAEQDELRALSDEAKLRQIGSLMASAVAMGWTKALREGDEVLPAQRRIAVLSCPR